jgi:hypothetical protein
MIAGCIIALLVIYVSASLVYELTWRYGRINRRALKRLRKYTK